MKSLLHYNTDNTDNTICAFATVIHFNTDNTICIRHRKLYSDRRSCNVLVYTGYIPIYTIYQETASGKISRKNYKYLTILIKETNIHYILLRKQK